MRSPTLSAVKDFFFQAMQVGFATDRSPTRITVPELPGYKCIPVESGDFYLLDRWCANGQTDLTAGETTIWFQKQPVWVMHYGGRYNEVVIEFLKNALAVTYKTRNFIGGRGPESYIEGVLEYRNKPEWNEFGKFWGKEEIWDTTHMQMVQHGYHIYWGASLI